MSGALDILELPVQGTQFIEAGAGTGKTHTICNLFVRLVIEIGCSVDSILVLTFTNPATGELRERIEARLRQLANALRGAVSSEDDFAARLLARIDDPGVAQRRVDLALAGFDTAPIYTIHGFCQRVLGDHALLSRSAIDPQLLKDEGELRLQIARDFWRRELQSVSRLFLEYFTSQVAAEPAALLNSLKDALAKPYLEVRGGERAFDCSALEAAFAAAFASVAEIWHAEHEVVADLLLNSPVLKRNVYRSDWLQGWIAAVDGFFASAVEVTLRLSPQLIRFTPKKLGDAVKNGLLPPQHTFFIRCAELLACAGELAECYRQQGLALQRHFIDYANEELRRRKHDTGVQSFNDLLNNLHAALHGDNAAALRDSLRRRYGAALIDEFQDTDPLQYEIFRAIYADSGLPVYLVGDPKQAIYRFRGADVHAYLRARRELSGDIHSLTVNWRSDPLLIAAVNAIFQSAPLPFRHPDISFQPAQAAPRLRLQLQIDGRTLPPLHFWLFERDDQKVLMNKRAAAEHAAAATAAEIARLLSGSINEHAIRAVDGAPAPLSGGDIAVLVRTNRQGRQIRRALAVHGIDCVELADISVFDTVEAEELTHVLRAVEAPGDDTRMRNALVTGLLRDADFNLHELLGDEQAWEAVLLRFDGYHRQWREEGFFLMWQRLLDGESVLQRLLARAGGARQVTNLNHLVELMQAQAAGGRGDITQLIAWLTEMRFHRQQGEDESLLRLESDANLVRIVTVHRSKGLEYPIVFCPYLWDAAEHKSDQTRPLFFHDRDCGDAPVLQLNRDDPNAAALAREESRAEDMRLLYVALTRARHRCYVIWGAAKSAANAAPAWLLHRQRRTFADDAAFATWFNAASDDELRADLKALAASAPGSIGIAPLPASESAPRREDVTGHAACAAREFRGRIAVPWRLLSYSTLVRQSTDVEPDHDLGVQEAVTEALHAQPREGMFAFPRGAQAGSCLHAIFEHIDFTDRKDWAAVVNRELLRHGFSSDWQTIVLRMLEDVLHTPLGAGGPRLSSVTVHERVNELEFHYPFQRLAPRELVQRLAPFDADAALEKQLLQLAPERFAGYMKGFIDMVFESQGRWYIVDYKSNWLGSRREDYLPARLAQVMAEEAYTLQYLLYIVALHRMLRQRLRDYDYDRHVGGVFYLFVRAVNPHDDAGVFADRPRRELVQALDDYLRQGGGP